MTGNFDSSALDALASLQRKGNPDLVVRAIELFKREWLSATSTIDDALNEGNLKAVRIAAHTLRSSSAHAGASLLADRCHEIEIAAREDDFSVCARLTESLDGLFNEYCVELDMYLARAA